MGTLAIQAEKLRKRFGSVVAVDDVSFSVSKGEVFGFLGPNGAGKTTTIRMLTGILTPDSGRVVIAGIGLREDQIGAKMRMGVVPEVGNVYVDLTAKQNLRLAGRYYGLPKDALEKRSEALISSLGLHERRNDLVRTFSKGMRQRVSIACAIIHEPDILFLDEPTEGLDVQSRRLIIETVMDLNRKGSTIFLTTHNIEEANRLCERVCVINRGKIVALDRPEILRRTFDKTQSIEVSFDRSIDPDVFASGPVTRTERYGDKLRLYTDDPDRSVKHVAGLAEKEGLRIVAMTVCGPSLEEAFVRLTKGEQ